MDNDNIFEVIEPHWSRRVFMPRETWETHILSSTGKRLAHTIMKDNEDAVIDTLEDPELIGKSDIGTDRYVYFKQNAKGATYSSKLYTVVPVEFGGGNVGEVITAFPSEDVGGVTGLVYANVKR